VSETSDNSIFAEADSAQLAKRNKRFAPNFQELFFILGDAKCPLLGQNNYTSFEGQPPKNKK